MDQFHLPPLLALGLLMSAGYLAALGANRVGLPRVTGYIAAGVVLSPSITNILRAGEVEVLLGFVSEMALSVIAFAIGGSLKMSRVKVLGKPILWITITQGAGAFLLTAGAVVAVSVFAAPLRANGTETFWSAVLLLGAISVATAPAATMAVVHELRAEGPVTTTLLGIVALDDALAIILFSAAVGVAGALQGLAPDQGPMHGLLEIGGALVLGAIAGFVMPRVLARKRRTEINLVAILGGIFLVSGVSVHLGFSPLLATMTMGFTIINYMRHADHVFHELDTVEESLYCLFFVLAGAHFDVHVLGASFLLGLTLLAGRFGGKIVGTAIGGYISRAPSAVRKYVGITLLPQAGLSLGLIFQTKPFLPESAYIVVLNAMLASVILNELVSPPLVKWALVKAGESRGR